jgi:hypothetical protein
LLVARRVSTSGPSSVIAIVCSECAVREPSAERIVHPSLSKTIRSVVAANHGSSAIGCRQTGRPRRDCPGRAGLRVALLQDSYLDPGESGAPDARAVLAG